VCSRGGMAGLNGCAIEPGRLLPLLRGCERVRGCRSRSWIGRRMKIKGAGFRFGRTLRRSRPSDRSGSLVAGRQIGSCGLESGECGVDGRDGFGFRPRGVGTGALAASCRSGRYVRLFVWARADDVAKRRRQGLVVCRAASPFEGLFDARPGVTLAPAFAAWLACQSRTVRA
jgi:hypothetical protein